MKKLFIIFLFPFVVKAQSSITTAPLYIPSSAAVDSVKVPTVVSGTLRNIYTIDLTKNNIRTGKYSNDSTANKTAIATKVNISDTAAMLSPYLRKIDSTLANRITANTASIAIKVNISDTGTMLNPYLRKNDSVIANRVTAHTISIAAKLDTSGSYLSTGAITWPGTIYNSPTTGLVTNHAISYSPALTSQSAYTLLGRGSGSGVPSFLASIDSNWIPTLHSKSYYDGIYQPTASNLPIPPIASPLPGAYHFKRTSSQYFYVPSTSSLQLSNMTLAGWLYLDSKTGINYVIASKDDDSAVVTSEYWLGCVTSLNRLQFQVETTTGTNIAAATTYGSPPLNTWIFVAGWYDSIANTVNVQINNGTVQSTAVTGTLRATSTPFTVGGDRSQSGVTSGSYMDGRLASVALWKRVLTSTEITELYNAGKGKVYDGLSTGIKSNLLSWYDLRRSNADSAGIDATGTNNLISVNSTTIIGGLTGLVGINAYPKTTLDVAGTNASAWVGISSATNPNSNTLPRLVVGDATNASKSGEIDLIANETTDGFYAGSLGFANYNLGTTEKRIAYIAGALSGATNSGNLLFFTANGGTLAERMKIFKSGNVSIDSNVDNGYRLEVSGKVRAVQSLESPTIIGGPGTTSPLTLRATSGTGTTGADIILQSGTNGGTELARFMFDGKVGIGTAAPRASLSVKPIALGGAIWTGYTSNLQLGQLMIHEYSTTPQVSFNQNNYFDGTNTRYISTGYSTVLGLGGSTGDISFTTYGTGTAGNVVSGGAGVAMTIKNAGNVGIGTASPNSTLQTTSFATGYVAKTAQYTATASDDIIECTSGTFTVTLPTAVGITGREYWVTDTGSGTITAGTTSSQTFINVTGTPTTLSIAQFTSYRFVSNGANWMAFKIVN